MSRAQGAPEPEPFDKDQCARCRALIAGKPEFSTRESTGFGPHNHVFWYFCSLECRAHWLGRDPVLERYPQSRLSSFRDSGLEVYRDKALQGGYYATIRLSK